MRGLVITVVAIIAGLIGFVLMWAHGVQVQRSYYAQWGPFEQLVVAAQGIRAGAVIRRGMLKIQEGYPNKYAHRTAVRATEIDLFIGRRTLVDLHGGQVLLWDNFKSPSTHFDIAIPVGFRAMSITVTGAHGVSGLIRPGSRVDVLCTFIKRISKQSPLAGTWSIPLLQKVTVLAVGRQVGTSGAGMAESSRIGIERRGGMYSTVTLKVTVRESQYLEMAQRTGGTLVCVLRNPDDSDTIDPKRVEWKDVLDTHVLLDEQAKRLKLEEQEQKATAEDSVEVFRGSTGSRRYQKTSTTQQSGR